MKVDITHAVVLVVGIVSYSVLTALGHDANALLTGLLGYAGGAGVSKLV